MFVFVIFIIIVVFLFLFSNEWSIMIFFQVGVLQWFVSSFLVDNKTQYESNVFTGKIPVNDIALFYSELQKYCVRDTKRSTMSGQNN